MGAALEIGDEGPVLAGRLPHRALRDHDLRPGHRSSATTGCWPAWPAPATTCSASTPWCAAPAGSRSGDSGAAAPGLTRRGTALHLHDTAAGWSSLVARRAHNPKVAGSNPAPATHERPADAGLFRSSAATADPPEMRLKTPEDHAGTAGTMRGKRSVAASVPLRHGWAVVRGRHKSWLRNEPWSFQRQMRRQASVRNASWMSARRSKRTKRRRNWCSQERLRSTGQRARPSPEPWAVRRRAMSGRMPRRRSCRR